MAHSKAAATQDNNQPERGMNSNAQRGETRHPPIGAVQGRATGYKKKLKVEVAGDEKVSVCGSARWRQAEVLEPRLDNAR